MIKFEPGVLKEAYFKDPDNWPKCPMCGRKANAQDANHWNVFSCYKCDIEFVVGSGALERGVETTKVRRRK